MIAKIDDIKKVLIDNPKITDEELMDRFGINEVMVISAQAFLIAEKFETLEDLEKMFPEFYMKDNVLHPMMHVKKWIVNALRSIWKLGR